jgi:haloalkane dehalogenase
METLRTPDDRFADLPGFPYEPRYAQTSDGLRMAYVVTSDEPGAGRRHERHAVLPATSSGCGRCCSTSSTSPGSRWSARTGAACSGCASWLSTGTASTGSAPPTRACPTATIGCRQDWGGLLGLRLVAEHGDRFDRVCAANTGLPDGNHRLPQAWWDFRDFVMRTEDLPIGFLVASGCAKPLDPAVQAAYDAPFPDSSYKAGPKAFPDLIPQTPDNPATPDNQRAWEALERFDKPFLCAFSDLDRVTAGSERPFLRKIPGAAGQPHTTLVGGGHFLQEDLGPELARVVADWARGG